MANTSATGGYLIPTTPAPAADLDLDLVFQAYVRGITGLSGAMVRPRWQPTVPQTPGPEVDWCAVGVTPRTRSQDYPAIQHDPAGDGQDLLTRHQELDVLVTFYGPNGMRYGDMLRDGAYLPQNSEVINALGIALVEVLDAFAVPELVNQRWQRRYDVPMKFRRVIRRTYPVLNLLSAEAEVQSDTGPGADIVVP
ncbi:LIC_12616 family protein [Bordetella bronchialis]|uniref:phage neck terminator protein n=1 Tax=Bordetella bronchialis TaxID=463025 RepID=UPI003CFE7367